MLSISLVAVVGVHVALVALDRCGAGADILESRRAEADFVVVHGQVLVSICADLIQIIESKGAQLAVVEDVQVTAYGLELICVKGAQLVVAVDVQVASNSLQQVELEAGAFGLGDVQVPGDVVEGLELLGLRRAVVGCTDFEVASVRNDLSLGW